MVSSGDQKYILCEFVNGETTDKSDLEVTVPVEACHSVWLLLKEPRKSIKTLIDEKEKVEVKWPLNCEVADVCHKRPEDVQWTRAVAVIKSQSDDWREIREQCKTYMAKGVPVVDMKSRKVLAKISSSTTTCRVQGRKRKVDGSKAVSEPKHRKKDVKRALQRAASDIINELETVIDAKEEEEDVFAGRMWPKATNMMTQSLWERKRKEREDFNNFDSSDSESEAEFTSSMSKEDLINKNYMLKAKVEQLSGQLKSMKYANQIIKEAELVVHDFKNIRRVMAETQAEMISVRDEMRSLKSGSSNNHPVTIEKSLQNVTPLSCNTEVVNATAVSCDTEVALGEQIHPTTDSARTENNIEDLGSDVLVFMTPPKKSLCSGSPRTSTLGSDAKSTLMVCASTLKLPSNLSKSVKSRATVLRAAPIVDSHATFQFGSKTLTGEELMLCKHTGNLSVLASNIFTKIFTDEEMALGNLTGKAPNGHSKFVRKEKLDEGRITAITDYIHDFLGDGEKMTKKDLFDNHVKKGINNKLNNFIKTPAAKSIYRRLGLLVEDDAPNNVT